LKKSTDGGSQFRDGALKMNRLAFELEDPMHRSRDYLNALWAILSGDSLDDAGLLAAQRVLGDAIEANDQAEAMRDAAFEAGRQIAA
jgi:hypothetical protein